MKWIDGTKAQTRLPQQKIRREEATAQLLGAVGPAEMETSLKRKIVASQPLDMDPSTSGKTSVDLCTKPSLEAAPCSNNHGDEPLA